MTNPPQGFAERVCELAKPLIKHKVRQMVRRRQIGRSDEEDVQQEVFKRLLERLPALYARQDELERDVKRILRQSVCNQLRRRYASKRDPSNVTSIDRVGEPAHVNCEFRDFCSDLDDALNELTDQQRQLCELLLTEGISAAARKLDKPRSTVQNHVARVRQIFEDRGLREYLASDE